jgi:hypothetical protein
LKRLYFAITTLIIFLLASAVPAQGPTLASYPDLNVPLVNANIAIAGTLDALKGNIATTFQMEQNDAGAIASLGSQVTPQITSLQQQVNDLNTKVAALSAQVAALTPSSSTNAILSWAGLPDGPYNGINQGVNFGTGFWCVKGGELAACNDGQPTRSLTFAKAVTITSVTFSTTTATTLGIKLINASGQIATANAGPIGQDVSFAPAWAAPTLSFTLTSTSGNAPDLRIRAISVQ